MTFARPSLLLVCCVALGACGGTEPAAARPEPVPPVVPTAVAAEPSPGLAGGARSPAGRRGRGGPRGGAPTAGTAAPDVRATQVVDLGPAGSTPPLQVFYIVHVQAAGPTTPYRDPGFSDLDTAAADNFVSVMEGIGRVADTRGLKVTWSITEPMARAVKARQGSDHLFRRLVAGGHEMGVHVNRGRGLSGALDAVENGLGLDPVVRSGLVFEASRDPDPQAAVGRGLATALQEGLPVVAGNLSPAGGMPGFQRACGERFGEGNDAWDQTGNLLFPWRPAYGSGDFCRDDAGSPVAYVDHVSISWLSDAGGQPVDVLGTAQFDVLRGLLNQTLQVMESTKPTRPAAWGFVTHLSEFTVGDQGENPADPAALAALDAFLAQLQDPLADGRIVFRPVGVIGQGLIGK